MDVEEVNVALVTRAASVFGAEKGKMILPQMNSVHPDDRSVRTRTKVKFSVPFHQAAIDRNERRLQLHDDLNDFGVRHG